jgi:N-sulfoglucosamine sulfohydrolase
MKGKKLPDTDHVFTHVNTVSSGKDFAGRCVRTLKRSYIWNRWPDGKTRYRVDGMSGISFAAMEKYGEHDSRLKERADFCLFRCPEEFYDLEKDPTEKNNLINHPAYQEEIAKFKTTLLAHMKDTEDPLTETFSKTIPEKTSKK